MMKNMTSKCIWLSLLLSIAPANNLIEDETFAFFGLEMGHQTIITHIPHEDHKETLVGVRYGQQTLDWRTMLTVSMNSTMQNYEIEVDKILVDKLFGTSKLRPYLGISGGYLKDDALTADNDGLHVGVKGGFLIYGSDSVDIDLSYHYRKVTGSDALDTMQGIGLAVHYFF
ncbi:MAG: hypothetical protein RL113_1206 [Pseudomonadota bacterium]